MRFMIIRKADRDTEAGKMPDEKLLDDMAQYNEALADAGIMRDGAGLKPSSRGARVRFSQGQPTVIDGPFTEAKELIAGFTIIDVGSLEEAIEWVKRWPTSDGNGNVELEIREFYELSDFPQGEAIERHTRLGERLGQAS